MEQWYCNNICTGNNGNYYQELSNIYNEYLPNELFPVNTALLIADIIADIIADMI